MLLSQKVLQRVLGIAWLLDGLLKLQPRLFTFDLARTVLLREIVYQPAPIAANLQVIGDVYTSHLILANLLLAAIEIEIGLFLLLGLWVRGTIIISLVWTLLAWYGGEGMGLLFTGRASVLTGGPGAILFYGVLGLAVFPRAAGVHTEGQQPGLLSRTQLRRVLAGFWILAALLQAQPFWWQQECRSQVGPYCHSQVGRLSQVIGGLIGGGGFNAALLDPVQARLSWLTSQLEVPLNSALIVIFLCLGLCLVRARHRWVRPFLAISLLLSLVIWWGTQGFGMVLTGLATDIGSGPLLVLLAVACWPKTRAVPRQAALPPASPVNQPASAVPLAELAGS